MAIQQNSGGFIYDPVTGGPVDEQTANNVQSRFLQIEETADGASSDAAEAQKLAKAYSTKIDAAVSIAQEARDLVSGVSFPATAAEAIAGQVEFRTGNLVVGIASDSTSDGATDWVRLWEAHMAERYPHLRIENNQWVDATGAYGPTTVVQEGTGEPAFSGDVIHDTFTRSTGITAADTGGPWEAFNPDVWTLNGSAAIASGTGRLRVNVGTKDMTTTTVIDLDSTGTGASQNMRVYHGDTTGVFAQLTTNGGGLTTAYVYRVVNGTSELVTSQRLDTSIGVPVNTYAGPVTVTIDGQIQNYTVTVAFGGATWSHSFTITESAYAAMEPYYAIFPQSAAPGQAITEATATVADRPATYQTLTVWSGTKGGGTMEYQMDNWDAMFGYGEGQPGTPSSVQKRTMTDEFSRTGQVSGSSTDSGQVWGGSTVWTANGSSATASGSGSVVLPLTNVSRVGASVDVVTTSPAVAETLRIGANTLGDVVNGIFLGLGLSTTGAFTASAYVRTPTGGFRDLGPISGHGVASNVATTQAVAITINRSGLDLTFSVGAGSATFAITQAEANELGQNVELQAASTTLGAFKVDRIEADHDVTVPGTDPTPGRKLDVMILAHGHNYGSMGADEFTAKLSEFRAFMEVRQPNALLLLSSQNPQFAPAANPSAHASRLLAMRRFAKRSGLSYAPVFEHFAAQADGGESWVLDDGVHPTAPPSPLPTVGYGMSEWGKVLADSVTSS